MIPLVQLQRQFQQHLLAADPAIAGSINESEQIPATVRLAIYSEAYRLRLMDALASNFPRLQQLLGQTEFAAIACTYIDSHPSTFRSIRWFGAALPACLEISHAERPWLADLASWEWRIATAFDASDMASIGPEALGQVPPDRWPGLQFEFHRSLQRVLVKTNAPALFKALGDDHPSPQPQVLEREQPWL
ncbi:MAG: HvfC/BufC family peptide modification chaperone, partial [Steroidobacter sp.]